MPQKYGSAQESTSGINVSGPKLHRPQIYFVVVFLVYLLVSALGITTSHTSILFGAESEKSHILLGQPRHQRSDEFLRGSPRVIASLRGIDRGSYTPLDVSGSDEYWNPHNSYLGKLVEWTRPPNEIIIEKVADIAPLRVGFSMLWWGSTLLLLIALPLWFKLLCRSITVGAICALAIFFTSTNAWF